MAEDSTSHSRGENASNDIGVFLLAQRGRSNLFGHLDTNLMMKEFHHLAEIADTSLEGLNVVVTHRKESLKKGPDMKWLIEEELAHKNDLARISHTFSGKGIKFSCDRGNLISS